MANTENFSVAKKLIKSSEEFEKDLKLKLKWSRSQWNQSGESKTRINKLVNSMNYWKSRLKPALDDTSIIFTVFSEDRDVKIDIALIIEVIESLNVTIQVRGYSNFRNPRYLCIYFENKNDRDYILDNFKLYENGHVVYLNWALDTSDNVEIVKVHWLPMNLGLDIIKKELSQFVNFIDHTREALRLMSGREVPSGMVTFKAKVLEGVKIENIPHTTLIGGMEALITIPGRAPLCLNCDILGHVSKNCKLRFCQNCNQLKPKVHKCETNANNVSYSAILKGNEPLNNFDESEDWDAAFVEQGKNSVEKVEPVLSSKILILEKQVRALKTETELIANINSDKKKFEQISEAMTNQENMLEEAQEYVMNTDEDSEEGSLFSDSEEFQEKHNLTPMICDKGLGSLLSDASS